MLERLSLALGGEAASRLTGILRMHCSLDTLLRLLHHLPEEPLEAPRVVSLDDWGATRSRRCSRKDSQKEDLTWGSAPKCPTRLNQVRLGQRSRVHQDGLEPVRGRGDC